MKLDRDDIAAITGICAGSALLLLLFVACLVGNKLWERYQNRLEPAEDRPNVTYEATYWVSCTFTKFMKMCPHAEDHTHIDIYVSVHVINSMTTPRSGSILTNLKTRL